MGVTAGRWEIPCAGGARVVIGDLLLLQKAGNWSSLKMVERYAHVREGRDAEVMRQMEAARAAWARRAEVPTKTPRPISRAPRNA